MKLTSVRIYFRGVYRIYSSWARTIHFLLFPKDDIKSRKHAKLFAESAH